MRRQFSCNLGASVVDEAHRLALYLVDHQRRLTGCYRERAIHEAASSFGFDAGTLHALVYRWRERLDVSASVLERLRMAYEHLYERQRQLGRMAAGNTERVAELSRELELAEIDE